MKNAVSDGYFVPARYQTPPGPSTSSRRRQQRRLGPVVRQRLDTLEERRRRAEGEGRIFSGAPKTSRSATELSRTLPSVYAGVATVTDLTATSSSVDTLFSHDESVRAGGDLECLALDVNEETERDLTELSDDAFGEPETRDSVSEGIQQLGPEESLDGDMEETTIDPPSSNGSEALVISNCRGTVKNDVAMIVSQRWKRRLDNNRSVLNLCRRISLMDHRKVNVWCGMR